jgi:hypothetical protein
MQSGMRNQANDRLVELFKRQRNKTIFTNVDEMITSLEDINVVIPLNAALDIYSSRARINAKRGRKIKGYERLLPALEQTCVSKIRITKLVAATKIYIVFTDEEYSDLFGVLDIPKKKQSD